MSPCICFFKKYLQMIDPSFVTIIKPKRKMEENFEEIGQKDL